MTFCLPLPIMHIFKVVDQPKHDYNAVILLLNIIHYFGIGYSLKGVLCTSSMQQISYNSITVYFMRYLTSYGYIFFPVFLCVMGSHMIFFVATLLVKNQKTQQKLHLVVCVTAHLLRYVSCVVFTPNLQISMQRDSFWKTTLFFLAYIYIYSLSAVSPPLQAFSKHTVVTHQRTELIIHMAIDIGVFF